MHLLLSFSALLWLSVVYAFFLLGVDSRYSVDGELLCDPGSRLFDLSPKHRGFVDYLSLLCTGGGKKELQIPDPTEIASGGPRTRDWSLCIDTDGLKVLRFAHPNHPVCGESPIINCNVTCADDQVYSLANDNE